MIHYPVLQYNLLFKDLINDITQKYTTVALKRTYITQQKFIKLTRHTWKVTKIDDIWTCFYSSNCTRECTITSRLNDTASHLFYYTQVPEHCYHWLDNSINRKFVLLFQNNMKSVIIIKQQLTNNFLLYYSVVRN